MTDRHIEISIDTWGGGPGTVDDDLLSELIPALARHGASGPVTSAGGIAGGIGASFCVIVPGSASQSDAFSTAWAEGLASFERACAELGLEHDGVARIEVLEPRYMELELAREPDRYLGVTEIAEILGVSRQRVMQLRQRDDFPEPVAELAAGPVWKMFNLQRFIREWPRKPGRPKKLESA
jgi:hypothetical protein